METENFSLELGGRPLVFENKNLAEQASGQALLRYGDTLVLVTVVISNNPVSGKDFFPLTVEYEERYYAAGKIKGPRYIKRESRPSDKAILSARLIDRAIRPRFPRDLGREVQVVATVLSWDGANDPNSLGLIAASLALSLSAIPWQGPLACCKVGRFENQFLINPTSELQEKSDFILTIAADFDEKGLVINMLEAEGEEVSEEDLLGAVEFSQPFLRQIIDFQKQIATQLGREKEARVLPTADEAVWQNGRDFLTHRLEGVLFQADKLAREKAESSLKQELGNFLKEKYPEQDLAKVASMIFEQEYEKVFDENILQKKKRPDGRQLDELRSLQAEVGLLPRTHGSGLFVRGQTKALSILTLGAPGDQQILEGMEITGKKRFMHHYNFPPYSSGEIKPMRGPGRREIGHGMLGERALLPLIPSFEEFPYTIRVVSEIVSSNGSTSMASISGASLALMDAGVPLKSPAAGISIGLALDEQTGQYELLTDIQGPEDHYGDMDFKVAGTRKGITVLQMDVKGKGISAEIFREALTKAKKARFEILDFMEKILPAPRPQLSPFAPRIVTLQINPDKIRDVVGPGGKIINEIIAKTNSLIDIEQTGLIFITAETEVNAQKALDWIKSLTHEVQLGEIFTGKVTRLFDFGAMVEILPGQEGLIHISELAPYRVEKVQDVVQVGQEVRVKVVSIDSQGRINLSLRALTHPDATVREERRILNRPFRPERRDSYHGRRKTRFPQEGRN